VVKISRARWYIPSCSDRGKPKKEVMCNVGRCHRRVECGIRCLKVVRKRWSKFQEHDGMYHCALRAGNQRKRSCATLGDVADSDESSVVSDVGLKVVRRWWSRFQEHNGTYCRALKRIVLRMMSSTVHTIELENVWNLHDS
jgi:hypothetical protein